MPHRLSPERIERAAHVIDPAFTRTPQLRAEVISRAVGADVTVKIETLNPIRSFKGRGASFFVQSLTDDTPLVCASAGNFGQGLAHAATRRGVPLTVFAATTANTLKLSRMRELGATVTLHGRDFDEAKDAAREHADRHGLRYVEDGLEPEISEGAGTIALELLQAGEYDTLVVPLGNGALAGGVGTWVKAAAPGTRVVAVAASGAPSMALSYEANAPISTPTMSTIADGIGVRVPVPEAVADIRAVVDEVLLVDDADILNAMRLALHTLGVLVEPAGAAGLAGLLAHAGRFAGQRIAVPLCGANVTETQFRTWFLSPEPHATPEGTSS